MDMVQARAVAERIRQDIRRLFDITVSIGVSFNKVFAKLGSDMKKPDAVTCIAASEFRHQVWGLPVSQLLGVGRATAERLRYLGIVKIGQLATCDRQLLRQTLGKNGDMLWLAANGLENTPVRRFDESEPRQSLGHGTTLPVDIGDVVQIWPVIESLSERVAFELQAESLTGCGLQLMVRDSALQFHLYQHKFSRPLCTSRQIANCSLMLLSQRYMWMRAIRAIGIRIYGLRSVFLPVQRTWMDYVHSLDTHTCDRAADAAVDQVIRAIQGRFGTDCMRRGYQCNGIKSQPGFFPSVYGRGGG